MTEGHAAHRIAERLGQLIGRRVSSSCPSGDFAAERLHGARVTGAEAVGKHLLVHFAEVDSSVHVHLAMRGRWAVRKHRRALDGDLPRTEPPIKGYVGWRMLSATHHAELTDPSICEQLDEVGVTGLHQRLGPDPLRSDADPELAVRRILRSHRPIGELIVDQSVIAGIGNVYRAELLHRARLNPYTPGDRLGPTAAWQLWDDTVALMEIGRAAGWIISDERQVATARAALVRGDQVPRARKVYAVYGRAARPCGWCGTTVRVARLGRQRIFWCPSCQPPDDGL